MQSDSNSLESILLGNKQPPTHAFLNDTSNDLGNFVDLLNQL